jgi:hypothetical protein
MGKIVYSLQEAQVLSEAGRRHSTTARPHSVLGYPPPEAQLRPSEQSRPAVRRGSPATIDPGHVLSTLLPEHEMQAGHVGFKIAYLAEHEPLTRSSAGMVATGIQ